MIPYARVEIEKGLDGRDQLVRICPVCVMRIAEHTDRNGEATTNNYGTHYASAHGNPLQELIEELRSESARRRRWGYKFDLNDLEAILRSYEGRA